MAEPEVSGCQSAAMLSVEVDEVPKPDGSPRIAPYGLLPYGPVEMRVPSDPLSSRVLRLAASGVASLGGFTVDKIEDINMAVSEVLIALIEHGIGDVVDVEFAVDGRSFTVRGRTANQVFDVGDPDLILCRRVLSGVCSEYGIQHVGGHAQIWAVVDHVTA